MDEAEVLRLDAALAALWAARSPAERAAEDAFLQHERESMKYLKDLLDRAGIKAETDDLSWPVLMAAWRELGLPMLYFARGTHRFLAEKLEVRLSDLARLAQRGEPTPQEIALPKSIAGKQSVGKKGTRKDDALPVSVDVELLRQRRGSKTCTAHARWLRMARTTYLNIETFGRTTLGNAKKIATRLEIAPSILVK